MRFSSTLFAASFMFSFCAVVGCSTTSESETEPESAATSRGEESSPPADEERQAAEEADDSGEEVDDSGEEPAASAPLVDSEILPVGESPVYGNPDAPVTIVYYPVDHHIVLSELQKIVESYDGEVRLVVKHLRAQVLQHESDPEKLRNSEGQDFWEVRMALVLEALRRQDPEAVWPAIRVLSKAKKDFEEHPPEAVGAELAEEYGLDVEQYRTHLDDSETVEAVRDDTEVARGLGITGREEIVFNGERIGAEHIGPHVMTDMVERQRDHLEQLRSDGIAPERFYRVAVERRVDEEGQIPELDKTTWKRSEWSLPTIRRIPIGEDDPTRGPDDALVTIVQIADLENCFLCSLHNAFKNTDVMDEHGDAIRVVFKFSSRALEDEYARASRTLAAAGRQDRFWEALAEMLDAELQGDPRQRVSPEALADELDLDKEQFRRDLEAEATTERIRQSADDVRSADVRMVPSLIINGIEVLDPNPKLFEKIVRRQLAIARRLRDERGLSGEELREALLGYNASRTEEVWLGESGD